jgi:hypothetical protein
MMYVAMPYLLLDIYERGAAAETLALALLPWLFWALRRLLYQGDRIAFFSSAALIASVMLAHNITMLFVLPAALGYILLLVIVERRWAALGPVAAATVLGLGLCAFYWAPAILETKFTRAEEFMLGAGQTVTKSLRDWRDLLQSNWIADYQGDRRFRFAVSTLVFGLLGLSALPFLPRRQRNELGIVALFWLVVMFLQSDFLRWFWEIVPLVDFIQFTWRLFGLASLVIALLVGGVVMALHIADRYRWLVAVALVGLALWPSLQRLDPTHFKMWYQIEESNINLVDLFERGRDGFPLFSDYQPIYMNTSGLMMTLPQPRESQRLPPIKIPPALELISENFVHIQLSVNAPEPFTLRAGRIYFPGWQVYVDGRPVPTGASGKLGLVTAELPAGSYTASIQFDQTPVRRISDLVSLTALIIVVGGIVAGGKGRRRWLLAGVAGALIIAGVVYLQGPAKRMRTPVAAPVNFQDVVHLVGYQIDKPTWRPGELLQLRLYWFAQQAPLEDYIVFLHVSELDDSGKVAQMDTHPMFNFSSTTRWDSGELKTDLLRLPLDAGIKPGRYRLVIGLYPVDTVQNLAIRDGVNVLPGDRVALTEIEIIP